MYFFEIQFVYKLFVLNQKEVNIIQYFIYALAQSIKKAHIARFLTGTYVILC
jgi:hypothetical protein